jgi:DNA polymerase-3 subunit epsilon
LFSDTSTPHMQAQQLGLEFDPNDAAWAQPVVIKPPSRRGRPPAAKPTPEPTTGVKADAKTDVPPAAATMPQAIRPGQPDAAAAGALTLADMARTLDAHPDFRVLRRLVPTLDFGAPPAAATPPVLRTLLILDTETTGLDPARDKVIELALLRVTVDASTGQPVGAVQVYDGLEDPGTPIPPHITDITGITDDMVRGQRLDESVVAALMADVDLVVAHNAGFDRPFVESRLPAFAQLAWACSWADVDWKALGQGSAKLEVLALSCGWFYDAHRAETDCHALLAVLARPLGQLAAASDGSAASAAPTQLTTLLAAGQAMQYRLQATAAPFEAKDVLKARGYRWDGTQRVWATVLRSEAALQAELAWLADAVYGGRSTRVRVEPLDARQRYASRPGVPEMRWVEGGLLAG